MKLSHTFKKRNGKTNQTPPPNHLLLFIYIYFLIFDNIYYKNPGTLCTLKDGRRVLDVDDGENDLGCVVKLPVKHAKINL